MVSTTHVTEKFFEQTLSNNLERDHVIKEMVTGLQIEMVLLVALVVLVTINLEELVSSTGGATEYHRGRLGHRLSESRKRSRAGSAGGVSRNDTQIILHWMVLILKPSIQWAPT